MANGSGAGYNIPVSLSLAESYATPQNTAAGTVFNFASPFASGDTYSQQANPVNPATATSSAAQRDATAQTTSPTVVGGADMPGVTNWSKVTFMVLAGLILALVIWKKL